MRDCHSDAEAISRTGCWYCVETMTLTAHVNLRELDIHRDIFDSNMSELVQARRLPLAQDQQKYAQATQRYKVAAQAQGVEGGCAIGSRSVCTDTRLKVR